MAVAVAVAVRSAPLPGKWMGGCHGQCHGVASHESLSRPRLRPWIHPNNQYPHSVQFASASVCLWLLAPASIQCLSCLNAALCFVSWAIVRNTSHLNLKIYINIVINHALLTCN